MSVNKFKIGDCVMISKDHPQFSKLEEKKIFIIYGEHKTISGIYFYRQKYGDWHMSQHLIPYNNTIHEIW